MANILATIGSWYRESPTLELLKKKGYGCLATIGSWYRESPQYVKHPGWRKDPSDNDLADRAERLRFVYQIVQEPQTGKPIIQGTIEGLILNDVPRYTVERKIFGHKEPKKDFDQVDDTEANIVQRTSRNTRLTKFIDLALRYEQQAERVNCIIVLTCGEQGNVQMLQRVVEGINKLEQDGAIDIVRIS